MADDQSSDEDEVRESITSSLIKEICANGEKCSYLLEKDHPDTMLANRAVHICNNDMLNFRKILQCRQKQLTLDKFLVKKARKATAEE